MNANELIGQLLALHGIADFGVCRFAGFLPLRAVRSAARVPRGAQSVIICLFPYYVGEYPDRNIARYAIPADYHMVAGEILEALAAGLKTRYPEERFVPFVDNSPFIEVELARLAGLGVVGMHGQLIHQMWGTRVFIGEVVTTLMLEASAVEYGACQNCGRCVAACPTGALTRDRSFTVSLCRSHITQKKGGLTRWEQEQICKGGFVWGCDLCTDACPMNTDLPSPVSAFHRAKIPHLTLDNLDTLLSDRAYAWRGRAVLERNLLFIGAQNN